MLMVFCLLVVVACCHPLGGWLLERWTEEHGAFGHGPMVMIVAIPWLLLAARRAPRGVRVFPEILLALPALLLLWLLVARGSGSAGGLGAWLLLLALCTAAGGTAFVRSLFPVLGLLFFAMPWPLKFVDDLSLPLKELALRIGFLLAPEGVTREGESATLLVNGGELLVGDVCSGLRSSVSLLAVSWLFAAMLRLPRWRFVLAVAVAPMAAVLANGMRVAALVHVAAVRGVDACAPGTWVHDGSGIAAFVLAAALVLLAIRGAKAAPRAAVPAAGHPPRAWIALTAGAAICIAFVAGGDIEAALDAPVEVHFPETLDLGPGQFLRGREVELEPSTRALLRPTGCSYRAWGVEDRYSACLVHGSGREVRLHAPEICYRGAGWEVVSTEDLPLPDPFAGGPAEVHEILLARPEGRRLSWIMYRSGGRSTHSYNSFVWNALWRPGLPQALVFVSAPVDAGLDTARAELRWLMRQLAPALGQAFRNL